jgi:hypothetical protein
MAAKKRPPTGRVVVPPTNNPSRGAPLTLAPIGKITRKSIRGIAKDLVGNHSTEIAVRLREGMLSENLRLSLRYLTFVGDRTDGRPVETHRMVGLQEGPSGSYDLSKLPPDQQKKLLALLRAAKDDTQPKGET